MASNAAGNVTAAGLLSQLAGEGLLDEQGKAEFQRFVIERKSEKEAPLFLRILLALGAFLSTIFFTMFLSVAKLLDFSSGEPLIVWGLAFMAGAVGLHRVSARGNAIGQAWLLQVSFSAMLTGKALVLIGAMNVLVPHYDPHRQWWTLTYVAAAVTAAAYPVFPVSVDRFLSVFVVLMAAFSAIVGDELRSGGTGTGLTVWFIMQLVAAAVIVSWGRVRHTHLPVAYALISSLCVIVAFWGFYSQLYLVWGPSGAHYTPSSSGGSLALAAALIALIAWAAGGPQKLKSEPLALASLGAVALGALSAAGNPAVHRIDDARLRPARPLACRDRHSADAGVHYACFTIALT